MSKTGLWTTPGIWRSRNCRNSKSAYLELSFDRVVARDAADPLTEILYALACFLENREALVMPRS